MKNSMVMALALREDGTYTPFSTDGLLYAAKMTLLGVGAVFAVLIVLMIVIKIVGRCVNGEAVGAAKDAEKAAKEARRAEKEAALAAKEQEAASETVTEPTPDVPAETVAPIPNADDAALIAVLAAAIAAYREAEGADEASSGGFRVVSFKRVGGGRAWNASK